MKRRLSGRLLAAVSLGLLSLGALVAVAFLEGDLPDLVDLRGLATEVKGLGWLGALGLLYLEESGLPMPVPGDFFVMYVGNSTGGQTVLLIGAWLALIAVVVFGATNLYLLARRFGRRWLEGRVGALLHVTPERVLWAEQAFRRWGVLAVIFGRHVPGFRVPITVVAGALRMPYAVFAASVAVSTAVWAAVFLFVGVKVGPRVSDFLSAHRGTYVVVAAVVAMGAVYLVYRGLRLPAGGSGQARKPS